MDKLRVTIFSHHFSVTNVIPAMRSVVDKFATWFDEYEFVEVGGQWSKEYKQSFSYPEMDVEGVEWKNKDLEFRFHINSLAHFKNLLLKEHVREEDVEFHTEPIYEAALVQFKIKPHFKPFPEQEPMIPQICSTGMVSKLLPLQTGGGKSYLSLVGAHHWGMRACYFMKPGYIDKWVGDIGKTLEIDVDKDIETVFGSAELVKLIEGIIYNRIEPHIVLISNATFRNWISEQEKLPPGQYVTGFPCTPWEFMQICGFGYRVIDEVHQDFHANFRFDLVTHVEQSLSLSATLVTRSEFTKKMYKMAYPSPAWIEVPEYRKYIKATSFHYDFLNPSILKTTARGRSSYSHVEFEKSIMRSSKLFKQYLMMIYDVIRKTYMFERKQGEKCLVYFATRKMCEDAVMYFRQLLPHLKITKYNQGDPLTNITEADLCFATLGKAGTAIDIPNLTTVLLTVAIDSIQSNLQSAGRLRDLKRLYDSDRIPLFIYFVCENIQKHIRYHKSKQELLKDRALHFNMMQHNVSLGS